MTMDMNAEDNFPCEAPLKRHLSLLQSETSPAVSFFDINLEIKESQLSEASISEESKTSLDFDSDFDSDDSDDLPFTELLLQMEKTDEELLFRNYGFKHLNKICDTLQGELHKAEVLHALSPKMTDMQISVGSHVAIKKTDKDLLKNGVAIKDEMTFCVSQNAIKEALILQQLTLETAKNKNNVICDRIVKFIDCFESESHFYLVMEYVENGITLKEFIKRAHELINAGKLSLKDYAHSIKYVMWQLIAVIRWLHEDIHCCHLDICLENIMLTNWQFVKQSNDSYKINDEIAVKLCDFGVPL